MTGPEREALIEAMCREAVISQGRDPENCTQGATHIGGERRDECFRREWQEWADPMRAALAVLEAAGWRGPVSGWRSVPIEPTEEMIIAGDEANPTEWNDGTDALFGSEVVADVYAAMISAAPEVPHD